MRWDDAVVDRLPRAAPELDAVRIASPAAVRREAGVLGPILRHEIQCAAGGFRFSTCALLIIALMAVAAVTACARFRSEVREQEALAADSARQLTATTVDAMAEAPQPAVKPPWRLALVVDGGQAETPGFYAQALSALVSPELGQPHSGNDRLPDSEPVDWMFTISVVLSMTAFVLGYDAVCGEQRGGTLKLLLSYPVPRWKVLAGKLLAVWGCLAAPFLAGSLLSLLICALWGGPSWSGEDLAKIALMILLGLWAALFFTLVALLVSSLIRDPASSLGVLALLWVTAVVVVPALGSLLAHRLQPIPAEGEVNRRIEAIGAQINRVYRGREAHWRRPEWAAVDGFAWERLSAQAENRRSELRDAVRHWVLDRKLTQARLARGLASSSPTSLLLDIAERLTGSALWRDRTFLEQARGFHGTLATWLRDLDAHDPQSPHILFFSGYLSRRVVDPATVPRFSFQEVPVRTGLAAALPALVLFALETLLAAVATFFCFSRYDAG
jgi:ABC-type transport system involved in multi-copper enzyme maturation permease subunit